MASSCGMNVAVTQHACSANLLYQQRLKKSGQSSSSSRWHDRAAVGPTDSPDALVFTYSLKQQLGRGLKSDSAPLELPGEKKKKKWIELMIHAADMMIVSAGMALNSEGCVKEGYGELCGSEFMILPVC